MKILILAGTGAFGSRLARFLGRVGHDVTVAGRIPSNAQALANKLDSAALQMDRDGDRPFLPAIPGRTFCVARPCRLGPDPH